MRGSAWNSLRNAFHQAALDPARALDLLGPGLAAEDTDDGVGLTLQWAIDTLVPVSTDPTAALARVHEVAVARTAASPPGSTLQLAAFQAQVATCADPRQLRGWLEGTGPATLPDRAVVDLDLRWRLLVRLAALGAVDRGELAAALAAEPTAVSQVEHARALAALPEAEAKAWAWQRFTGEVDAANYELAAIGLGMWQLGQEGLTEPYVARYFDDLPATMEVRTGQMLGEAAESFYPRTALTQDTVTRANALLARDGLDPAIRRTLVDHTDDLARQVAVLAAFGPA